MPGCPVCGSYQVVLDVAVWPESNCGAQPSALVRGRCPQCRARWEQRGGWFRIETSPPAQLPWRRP
jgi:hypothetical protein